MRALIFLRKKHVSEEKASIWSLLIGVTHLGKKWDEHYTDLALHSILLEYQNILPTWIVEHFYIIIVLFLISLSPTSLPFPRLFCIPITLQIINCSSYIEIIIFGWQAEMMTWNMEMRKFCKHVISIYNVRKRLQQMCK